MLFRLFQLPGNGNKKNSTSENIYSWVHKEFKENDINATKHRLLCKLDDMSHGKFIEFLFFFVWIHYPFINRLTLM